MEQDQPFSTVRPGSHNFRSSQSARDGSGRRAVNKKASTDGEYSSFDQNIKIKKMEKVCPVREYDIQTNEYSGPRAPLAAEPF